MLARMDEGARQQLLGQMLDDFALEIMNLRKELGDDANWYLQARCGWFDALFEWYRLNDTSMAAEARELLDKQASRMELQKMFMEQKRT